MTTLRASSSVARLFLVAAMVTAGAVSGCSHSDPAATDAGPAAAAAHNQPPLSPQQQMQQIQSNPNTPDKLKKVQMGNISGPPQHNRVGGPP